MKPINICYAIVAFMLLSTINIGAQTTYPSDYTTTTITTPNGTAVYVGVLKSGNDHTQAWKDTLKAKALRSYSNIIFLGEATWKYNCHAYAWANNTNVWMITPEQKKYWDPSDKSYVEVSSASMATKVSYGYIDHSAITTHHPDTLISKWAEGPLFKHHKTDSPYSISDLHYYAEPKIVATNGANLVCNTATYSLQSGDAAIWSITGTGFTISPSPDGRSATVRASVQNGQAGTVIAQVIQLTPGAKMGITQSCVAMNGPDVIGSACSATYSLANGGSGTWSVVGGGLTPSSSSGTSFTVSRTSNLNDPQYTTIRCITSQQDTINRAITARIAPIISPGVWGYGVGAAAAAQVGVPCYFQAAVPTGQKPFVQQYQWELYMNGSTYSLSGETTQNNPVTFTQTGIYLLRLRILDGCQWSKWVDTYVDVM